MHSSVPACEQPRRPLKKGRPQGLSCDPAWHRQAQNGDITRQLHNVDFSHPFQQGRPHPIYQLLEPFLRRLCCLPHPGALPPALPTTSRCPTLLDLPDAPGWPDVRVPDLPLGLFFSFIPSPSPPLLTKRSAFPTHPLLLLPSPPPLSGSGELFLPFFHVRELTNILWRTHMVQAI